MVLVSKLHRFDGSAEQFYEIEIDNMRIVINAAKAEELTDQLVDLLDWGEPLPSSTPDPEIPF